MMCIAGWLTELLKIYINSKLENESQLHAMYQNF